MTTIQEYVRKFNIKKQNPIDQQYDSKLSSIKKDIPLYQPKPKTSMNNKLVNVSKSKAPSKRPNTLKRKFKSSLSTDYSAPNLHFQSPGNLNKKMIPFTQRAPINNSMNKDSPYRNSQQLCHTAKGNSKTFKVAGQTRKSKFSYYNTPSKDKRTLTPVCRPNLFLSKFSQNQKSSLLPYTQGIVHKGNKNGKKCKTPVYQARKRLMNTFELNRSSGDNSLNISSSKEKTKKSNKSNLKFIQKVNHTLEANKGSSFPNNSDITSSTVKSVSKAKNDSKIDMTPNLSDNKKDFLIQPEDLNQNSNNINVYNVSPSAINDNIDETKKNLKKKQLSIQNDFESTSYTQSKGTKNGNIKNNNVNNNDKSNSGNKSNNINNMNILNNNNNINEIKFDKLDSPNSNSYSTTKKELPKINKILKKIKNKSCFTRVGFDGQQNKEFNQDSYQIFEKFANNPDYLYITVCDGHGDYGHLVSNYIQSNLPKKLSKNLNQIDIFNDTAIMNQIIQGTFVEVNKNLINEFIDTSFSGTTCCSVIYTPSKLICANLGDSRAVLGRFINGHWESFDLTRDHKPSEDDEAERIIENGGIIVPLCENGQFFGPKRIWVELNEYPGLAMSRSFGDEIAETVGKICVPEISEYTLRDCDKFFIVASDGVWEFFNSYDVISSIGKYYREGNIEDCCKYIYEASKERWLKEEETIDDITMVIVFFE